MDWIKNVDKSDVECFIVTLKVPIFLNVVGVGVNNFGDIDLVMNFYHKENGRYFSLRDENKDLIMNKLDGDISVLYKQYKEIENFYLCNIPSAIVIETTKEKYRDIRINTILNERT
jgi:hypothetical protein